MRRLLWLANALVGSQVRASVFEPLVADWQRELAATSGANRIVIVLRGFAAFVVCVVACAFTEGFVMGSAITGTAAVLISTAVLLALQMALNSFQFALSYPLEWRMWVALPMILPLAVPLAMLPIAMMLRGRGLSKLRQVTLLLAAGAVTAYLATALAPLTRGDVRDGLYEQMNQRALANDAAGRFQYPGTAMRMLHPTTPEQRAEFRRNPRYLEWQAEVTRPRFGREAVLNGALAIALGGLGWALAGLRRATPVSIATWWATAWLALVLMGGRFSYWVNGAGVPVGGAPRWLPLATFSIAAVILLIADRRRRVTQSPTPST